IINGMLSGLGFQLSRQTVDEGHNRCLYKVISSRVRILVIDDEKRVLTSLVKTLEQEERLEYEILKSESGEEALELVHKFPIELVLCDHKLGTGITGTEVLERIRLIDPSIVRILITGFAEVEIARDAVNRAKIHYFIEKPPESSELKRIIYEELMKKRQSD
ncbi:MAG TPA: response regulator, partial [Candidatus Hodarchaeales archaeon]|nr:response regulator [Candidatus Hodarchaeales archaeon]